MHLLCKITTSVRVFCFTVTNLWARYYYHHPYFTDEKTKAQILKHLFKPHVISDRARIWIHWSESREYALSHCTSLTPFPHWKPGGTWEGRERMGRNVTQMCGPPSTLSGHSWDSPYWKMRHKIVSCRKKSSKWHPSCNQRYLPMSCPAKIQAIRF